MSTNAAPRPVDPALDLREADEASAAAEVRTTFAEIRDVLRMPFVDQLWRVLAREPVTLVSAWQRVAPALGTTAAEEAGDALRREAVIPLAIGLPSHKAFRGDMSRTEIAAEDRERISNYTSAALYLLPKLLLATAILRAPAQNHHPPRSAQLPRGVADGAPRVEPLEPDVSYGEAPALFAELRRRHGYSALADYYRSIARAGDFLRISLNALRPVIADHEEYHRSAEVVRLAQSLIDTLPEATERNGTVAYSTEVARILDFYMFRLIPETLVEVTVIKGLMDGPHLAAYNSYSLTDSRPPEPDFHGESS